MKRLHKVSVALGLATFLSGVAALVLDRFLPYRIGPMDYGIYTWSGRLTGISLGLAALGVLCGSIVRRGLPVCLSVFGLAPLMFMGMVHSGPNPQAWCYNNLRQIDGAKEQLAEERGLTNGSTVTMAQISRLMPDG